MVETNVFSGISSGTFGALTLYRGGAYQDLNVILNGLGGGGGGGAVTSATLPPSIANGVLSINLSGYMATTHDANKIATADVSHGLFNFETMTVTLTNGAGVTAQLSVGNSGAVSIGADGVLTVPMLNAWEFLALTIKDGNGVARALSSDTSGNLQWTGAPVFLPSAVTVGAGLFALASNPTGGLSLSLTGTESRAALKLHDTNTVVRDLTSNTSGDLLWNGASLATQTQLATKQDSITLSPQRYPQNHEKP